MSLKLETPPLIPHETLPTIEERRELIERVAASEQFRRSARLRDFLLYVGRQSLKDGCPDIHEQDIGAKVFGRSPTYDRSQDNIVRVNATDLRKRIESYFASEGASETLILEIPRGGYKPIFHRRTPDLHPAPSVEPVQPGNLPSDPAGTTLAGARKYRLHPLWAAACLALAIACALLFQQNRAMQKLLNPWEGKPAVATFWGDFLRDHQQTDIILPDDAVSLVEDLNHRPMSISTYLNHSYLNQIESSDLSLDRKFDLREILNHNLITFGGVRAAQQMLALIPPTFSPRLTLSRYYEADAIKRNNIILIGGRKANPWVHLFDDQLNFITDYDDEHPHALVRNRNPKPGEQPVYLALLDPNAMVGYSVLAYLPNPSRTGNAIILAGTDSDATDAAAEFLNSEEELKKLQDTLHVKQFPYFEVLLKTSHLSGTSLSSEIVAYRTYSSPK